MMQVCASFAVAFLVFWSGGARAQGAAMFPVLPAPPDTLAPLGLGQALSIGRLRYRPLITIEAQRQGLPPDIADAVAQVESNYRPDVVGTAGEVGLMQVRPQTASMLGHTGSAAGLFDPATNIRFGVSYLTKAWRLSSGDLCRTLMKYRAGWGEERMSALSVEYCRRAQVHLARIGSPLLDASLGRKLLAERSVFSPEAGLRTASLTRKIEPTIGPVIPLQVAGLSRLDAAWAKVLRQARAQARSPRGLRTSRDSRQFWMVHEDRIRHIRAKLRNGG